MRYNEVSNTKVVLIDDHLLIHYAVAHLLKDQTGFDLVAMGTSIEEAELLVKQHRPQVGLLEIFLPPKRNDGFGDEHRTILPTLQHLQFNYPETNILILSAHLDNNLVANITDLDIRGYLLKDDPLTHYLLDAIRTVSLGGYCFSQAVVKRKDSLPDRLSTLILTIRQIEILEAIVSRPNLSHTDHARRLHISKNTLDTHLKNIYGKLGVHNLTAAVIKAIEMDAIPSMSYFFRLHKSWAERHSALRF